MALVLFPPITVYAIEATVHAPTWEGVYDQIRRVLKPGGVVSCRSHKSFSHAN